VIEALGVDDAVAHALLPVAEDAQVGLVHAGGQAPRAQRPHGVAFPGGPQHGADRGLDGVDIGDALDRHVGRGRQLRQHHVVSARRADAPAAARGPRREDRGHGRKRGVVGDELDRAPVVGGQQVRARTDHAHAVTGADAGEPRRHRGAVTVPHDVDLDRARRLETADGVHARHERGVVVERGDLDADRRVRLRPLRRVGRAPQIDRHARDDRRDLRGIPHERDLVREPVRMGRVGDHVALVLGQAQAAAHGDPLGGRAVSSTPREPGVTDG